MTTTLCPGCEGSGARVLPDVDGPTLYPCPVCQPWPQGFPGERTFLDDWIIEPAPPGVAAKWNGWPER